MFFIYDYKYSGEHRVRLVFDGSKQSAATYSVTYAPTVRAESVRLFHIYAIEYNWDIQQYDVPQAFLRSDADCDIFDIPESASDLPYSARSDAILILHVDDMRVAAAPAVLATIHQLLFQKFEITISDSGRFLGMDTTYDMTAGIMRMHMTTYINETAERFLKFDLSQGAR
jgi:hypothetical protein